jgi:flavin reductase
MPACSKPPWRGWRAPSISSRPTGRASFTATAVCSLTADPPALLVCVNESSSLGQTFVTNRYLAINTIAEPHADLALLTGSKAPVETRFAADWGISPHGVPLLSGALAAFDAVVEGSQPWGTHRVLFCRILGITLGEDRAPSLYYDRAFRSLSRPDAPSHR